MPKRTRFLLELPQEIIDSEGTVETISQALLEDLADKYVQHEMALWELVRLYAQTGRQQLAVLYVKRLLRMTDEPSHRRECYLSMGQLAEQMQDFEGAVSHYSKGLEVPHEDAEVTYFLHNNLGYALSQLGRFREAEPCCREAIGIDPSRPNAHKNLGLALAGQGCHAAAAKSYIAAVETSVSDPRALGHLEQLIKDHAELRTDIPDIDEQVRVCKEAVEAVETADRLRKIARSFSAEPTLH